MSKSARIALGLVESLCARWEDDASGVVLQKKQAAIDAIAKMLTRTFAHCLHVADLVPGFPQKVCAHHLTLMKMSSPENNARAACRTTKEDIARHIRDLKNMSMDVEIASIVDGFQCVWPDAPDEAKARKEAAIEAINNAYLDLIEECAQVADNEPEFPGDPPPHHLELMKAASPEEVARTASSATKKSIVLRMRAVGM